VLLATRFKMSLKGRGSLKMLLIFFGLISLWASCVFYVGRFRSSYSELTLKHPVVGNSAKHIIGGGESNDDMDPDASTRHTHNKKKHPNNNKGRRQEIKGKGHNKKSGQHRGVDSETPFLREANRSNPLSELRIGNASAATTGGAVPYYAVPANAPLAYLLIISNEDFVDGALVLGKSLRMHCPRLQDHTADLSIIITEGRVSPRSQNRLRGVGFDKIFEVPSLALKAPGAYWKDTFDKIYMFNLTQYQKIVFMDADMINIRSMDVLFEKDFGDSTFVGAIGFRGGSEGPYFQTGMMVIQPTRTMFDKIYERFLSGVPPRGSMYNHGMNGRDGVLLRDVFGNRFKILDNKYSRNLNPRWPVPPEVISLHLRGKIKPWFDRSLPNLDPELGKKEFGHPYVLFWDIYENMIHKTSEEYQRATAGLPPLEPYGGRKAAAGVTPLTHVWMMRYSSREYVQLTTDEDRRRRLQLPGEGGGLTYVIAPRFNMSCDEVCGGSQDDKTMCSESSLSSSYLQNCSQLLSLFGGDCKRCEVGVYWRPHPGSDYPALDAYKGDSICKYNLLFDERGRPKCNARYEHSRRACPCVPLT